MSLDRKFIAFAIFACSFMSAVEVTIVSTAIPSIVRDLNGFDLSSYLFSVYLLTSAVATTVFGKLSDLYGRKNLFQTSIFIFLIGSIMCGISRSMTFLIFSRAIQGIGSGAINTLSLATIGDVFEVEDRARIQGYNSTVWSLASLIAPVIGGVMLIKLSWHWIFFINIPIGLLSIYLIHRSYNTVEVKNEEKLDVRGLVLMTIFIVFIIQGLSSLEKNTFFSFNVLIWFIPSVFVLFVFIRVERYVENPVLPVKLFSKEAVLLLGIGFLNSMVLIAMDVYNPSFMQNVMDYHPIMSTFTIVPMSVAWVISSLVLSKYLSMVSTKFVMLTSLIILLMGSLGLYFLKPDSSIFFIALSSSIIGFGFGGSYNLVLFIIQETLPKEDMGIASGVVMFIRTLGQTLGISLFALILNSNLSRYFSKSNLKVDTNSILSNAELDHTQVVSALFNGYNALYLSCVIIGIITLVIAVFMRGRIKLNEYSED